MLPGVWNKVVWFWNARCSSWVSRNLFAGILLTQTCSSCLVCAHMHIASVALNGFFCLPNPASQEKGGMLMWDAALGGASPPLIWSLMACLLKCIRCSEIERLGERGVWVGEGDLVLIKTSWTRAFPHVRLCMSPVEAAGWKQILTCVECVTVDTGVWEGHLAMDIAWPGTTCCLGIGTLARGFFVLWWQTLAWAAYAELCLGWGVGRTFFWGRPWSTVPHSSDQRIKMYVCLSVSPPQPLN